MAATARYFVTKEEYLYFHSYMADYFLGTYGGGVCKPFRYTEVQKHMFRLKSKSSTADRGVPAQPLAFYNKQGKLTRYNAEQWILYCNEFVYCVFSGTISESSVSCPSSWCAAIGTKISLTMSSSTTSGSMQRCVLCR